MKILVPLLFLFVLSLSLVSSQGFNQEITIKTPSFPDDAVYVRSYQLYSQISLVSEDNNVDGQFPFVLSPNGELTLIELSDFEFCDQDLRCLFNYEFKETGTYRFGYIVNEGTPQEQTNYKFVVYVEDNLGINSITSTLNAVIDAISNKFRRIFDGFL